MKRLAFLALAACALRVVAAEQAYVLPVVTAKINDRIYTTTLAARNDGATPATCEAIYSLPNDPRAATLRGSYVIPPGGTPQVERELLREAGAVGTLRLLCTAPVVFATRIQSSADGGATFDAGRIYAAILETDTIDRPRHFSVASDLLVAEVRGKAVSFEAVVLDDRGEELARKTYAVPGFAQQIVNLSAMREDRAARTVEIRTTGGDGAIVAAGETRDGALIAMTRPAARPAARPAVASQPKPRATAEASGPTPIALVGVASFKALPFVEPMTGLIYSRDRWYDPRSGSFMTPDPEGYADSANAYSYCAGDPVNCSDPTGRAASVSKSGVIIGIRPNGTRYTIQPGTDPVLALRALESDADIRTAAEQEDILRRARMAIPQSSAARPGEHLIGSAAPNNRRYTHRPSDGRWVEAAFVATTGLPPKTREQEILSGVVQIGSAVTVTGGSVRARVKGGVGPGVQPVFQTRAGAEVGVHTFVDASSPDPSALARARQGYGDYPGVDVWVNTMVPKGAILYAGEPGVSGFFTTEPSMRTVGRDATALFQGLQVAPRQGMYRPGVTAFEVIQDTPGAYSVVNANPQYGEGGLQQVFIPNWEHVLRPIQTDLMTNRVPPARRAKAAAQ